jgi:hypothetical protein
MSPDSVSERLAQARQELADARRGAAQARAAVLTSDANLQRLSRTRASDDQRVTDAAQERQSRIDALGAAAARERSARAAVDETLAEFLSADTATTEVDKLSAAFPIVLLPIRIETRFGQDDTGGGVLKVRIYPDELMADTHEPPLTEQERAAGIQFWRDGWAAERERDAWRALVTLLPSPRAAWVARVLTPVNVADRPAAAPIFPDVELRPHSWTRAAEARVLPDRWMAIAYRGHTEQRRAFGLPIQEPLALTLSPITDDEVDTSTVEIANDGLRLDADVAWTVDFDRAVQVGMGLTMPLDAALASSGIDRLIVTGVKASLPPDQTADRLVELLDAHHYGRGLAFLRQGTPTNNTTDAPSAFPPVDSDGALSFAVERGGVLTAPESNGTLFARAIGVPEAVVAHVEGSDLHEQPNARAMNSALWPATWGYFLDQLMDPVLSDEAVRTGRAHFVTHVRGRGPLPAFRTGATPYGVLPVSSLARWTPPPDMGGAEPHLIALLRNLRGIWMEQVRHVPRVGGSDDPNADLLGTLGMDASAREVRARPMLGPQVQNTLFAALNLQPQHWQTALLAIAHDVMGRIGHSEWNPRISQMTFADQAHLVRSPFVAPPPLSESEPLQPFNYISWIRRASITELREEDFPAGVGRPSALLYYLLRHAALRLYGDVATKVAIRHNAAVPADLRDAELPGVEVGGHRQSTVWERLDRKIPNVTGNVKLGDFLLGDHQSPDSREVRAFRTALVQLENLPTAELERLFTETLDACSHRLDTWITSLAGKRLGELRQQQPLGSHLGAFGWVEDLRPDPHRPGIEPAAIGGFVHAPSSSHAAAAAILRNAYLAHSGQAAERYAIDLSSTRVRGALELLDAVRQGQPLGAVLGYRFERGLHEGHRPLRLEKYIDPLRRLFPLVADKAGDSGEPAESIAARNVVDGLLLRAAFQKGTIPFGQNGLPAGGDDRLAIEAELRLLERAVDAVADLLTAESVFQIVRGNSAKAASVLDAVGQGLRPPESEIALQPRGGTTSTHRMAIVLGGDPLSPDPWSDVPETARSAAEPHLDRWVGSLLGDPATVRCRLSFLDASHQPAVRPVALSELRLRPLDLLALTGTLDTDAPVSELDCRVAALAPDTATEVIVVYAADPAADPDVVRTFSDVLEVARAINAMLATSRALEPKDLLPPEEVQEADAADRMPAEAAVRATGAESALNAATNQLAAAVAASPVDRAGLDQALRAASSFVTSGGFPRTRNSGDALLAQATTVLAELSRRSTAAAAASDPIEKVRAVFGRDFMFLPRFRAVNSAEMDLALAQGPALVDDMAITKWMQQVSRVRTGLATWRHLSLLAGALGGPPLSLTLAQLPHAADARWVGLPFSSEEERPPSGRVSLMMHRAVTPASSGPWVGLLVDEWNEIIPRASEDTAVAFHYDDPGAEAAQTILIAVPPTQAANWDLDTLLDTLNETLDLAKLRAVDGELLPLGQLLPAIYLASNPRRDTVSTDLRAILQRSPGATP